MSQSCKLGATFQSRGWSLASRELRCRGREVGDAIDCDISQAPPGAGRVAAPAPRWPRADWPAMVSCSCSPRSLISSAGFSAVHTDHSSGVAAPSEILPPVLNIHAVLSGLRRPRVAESEYCGRIQPAERWVHSRYLSGIPCPSRVFPDRANDTTFRYRTYTRLSV